MQAVHIYKCFYAVNAIKKIDRLISVEYLYIFPIIPSRFEMNNENTINTDKRAPSAIVKPSFEHNNVMGVLSIGIWSWNITFRCSLLRQTFI